MRSFIDKLSRPLMSADKSDRRSARRLSPMPEFGQNPGALDAHIYVPDNLVGPAPLVVILHGCTQTAADYDIGAGWSELADDYGLVLLFPEQKRSNNPNLCFNWFLPQDSRRDRGEALSIRNMVAAMTAAHAIDPQRIFVTGLSAGGAMASVMLAAYPDVFAGGAIIGGLPYGTAATVPQALERMRGQGLPSAKVLADLVRGATDHAGPWPVLSIWHGTADATVNPSNAEAIASQWRALHHVDDVAPRQDMIDGHPRQQWCDRDGRALIELFEISGMGHGTPIDTTGDDGCGKKGPFMLDVGISSTRRICQFWGLAQGNRQADRLLEAIPTANSVALPSVAATTPQPREGAIESPSIPNGGLRDGGLSAVEKVINDALRAAGLMR